MDGNNAEAQKALESITDPAIRNKKKLEITFYSKGPQACVNELEALVYSPQVPPETRFVYVNRVNDLMPANKRNSKFAALVLKVFSNTVVTKKNAPEAMGVFGVCEEGFNSQVLENQKLKVALTFVIDNSQFAPIIGRATDLLTKVNAEAK